MRQMRSKNGESRRFIEQINSQPKTEKQAQILFLVRTAISRFNKREKYLLENDLCERCICARFAMYVERALPGSPFKGYTTDVEYDRGMGGNDCGKKKIFSNDAYLDLIVHKRGYDDIVGYDNLFAIEMKKQGNSFEEDIERLQYLVENENGFCYRAGFAIRIISDKEHGIYELRIESHHYNEVDF